MIAGNYNKHECKCGHELRVCLATSCEYSELAPVAASLNLDDERAKFEAWARSGPTITLSHVFSFTKHPNGRRYLDGDTELCWRAWQASKTVRTSSFDERTLFEQWARDDCNMPADAPFNWDSHWVKAALSGWQARARRTPPAEVSADTLPALDQFPLLPEPLYSALGLPDIYTAEQMFDYARQYVAPYAEQIKNLKRELASLRTAFLGGERSEKIDALCEKYGVERELAERKQVQSIGDDAEFLWLLGDWMAGLDYFQSDEHKEVKMAWARLIAYIDARPAGTAPAPCRNCADFGWEPSISGDRRPCGFCKSGSTGTEESK